MLRGVFLRGIYLSQPSTLSPISSFSPHLSQRFGSTNRKKDQQQQQKTKKEEGKEKEKPKGGGSRRLTALPYNWKVEGIAPHLMVPSVPFSSLSVSEKMREGLKSCGFETATDIQVFFFFFFFFFFFIFHFFFSLEISYPLLDQKPQPKCHHWFPDRNRKKFLSLFFFSFFSLSHFLSHFLSLFLFALLPPF